MPTVGLAMIAKNEAANIWRALDSVKPLVNFALIEDTGSTDGTQQIVTEWLNANNIPGKVIEEPWRDFAHNRSHVLAELRKTVVDYALILDADDVLIVEDDPESIKRKLTTDVYMLRIRHGALLHRRAQICSNRKPFRYRGVVHEFLHCDEPYKKAALDGLAIKIIGGGVRGRNGAAEVYRRDADMLSRALAGGADPDLKPRYTFYLAQSWRDAGERERALAAYLQRADMEGWIEESYVALINAARLMSQLERPLVKVLDVWKRAMALIPTRVEAYHGAAVACRNAGCLNEALAFARRGLGRSQPEGLFIEPWIYHYGLLDEYAVAAYWTGLPGEALLASLVMLHHGDIDTSTRKRIVKNAAFAEAKCVNAN